MVHPEVLWPRASLPQRSTCGGPHIPRYAQIGKWAFVISAFLYEYLQAWDHLCQAVILKRTRSDRPITRSEILVMVVSYSRLSARTRSLPSMMRKEQGSQSPVNCFKTEVYSRLSLLLVTKTCRLSNLRGKWSRLIDTQDK